MRRRPLWLALLLMSAALRADDRVLVPAKVNGQDVQLWFDTGFGAGFGLWRAIADQWKLKLEAPPPGFVTKPGEIALAKTEPIPLEIFGQTLPALPFFVMEPPSYIPTASAGLVGWAAVRDNIIALRLGEAHVSTLPSLPADTRRWTKLAVDHERPTLVLFLPAPAGKPAAAVLVDTGMDDGVHLAPAKWREWRAAHRRSPATMDAHVTLMTGLVVREQCWADDLDLGGLTLHGVVVSEAESGEMDAVGPNFLATFGYGALRRLDLTVDARNGVAYARSRTDRGVGFEHNRLGVVFVPASPDNEALVAHVAVNSPAAAAKIRDGDVLLKIDQLDVTPWRTQPGILPLGRFWSQPANTKLALTLRRGAQVTRVEVVLKDILGPAR